MSKTFGESRCSTLLRSPSANDSFPVFGYRLRSCKKREKRSGVDKRPWIKWAQVRLRFCDHTVGVNTTSCLSTLHMQDVLWHRKPYLKVSGREGRSPVQQGRGGLGGGGSAAASQKTDSPTRHVTSDASPPLSFPAPSNLLACLRQRRLRSSCSAHSELIDPQLCRQKHLALSPSPASLRTP